MKEKIENLRKNYLEDSKNVVNLKDLEELRIKYLSKSGLLSSLLTLLKDAPKEDKPLFGKELNILKAELEQNYELLKQEKEKESFLNSLTNEKIDVTLPATTFNFGSIHPLNRVIKEVEDLFVGNGFTIETGPELETDYYNFELMGLPKGHPARSMQDSFYITQNTLLRTHTSPVQARTMEKQAPNPIKIICPGKTYRRDNDDATHSHQFMQIEGLVVDKGITFSNLLYYLEQLASHIFPNVLGVRLRPSYFPFTEPSVEVDVKFLRNGEIKYIEILGAGMVSPEVLRKGGYDPKIYSGFAFGVGVERITMLKYGIDNIKNFYLNDTRFLKQFKGE
ncbi:MAG: phenylalanine--tRNA ligase subunit alpha [Acholeplasmatales bacterium]|jgi:phenylalanyl-tRNA synthetase alpha chain|nr:phenylalanine--tRNA ligase subunit alpha [Acholeplasmatales bacterium]